MPLPPIQSGLLGPETLPFLLVASGLALAIAETFVPGAHFIVVGVALLLAGIVGLLVPAAASPFVLAALVVAFGMATLYAYRNVDLYGGEGGRTSDSSSLRGATGRVTSEVTPGGGQVRLDEGEGGFDPNYSARSIEGSIPEGTEVVVVDPGGGNVLTVQSLAASDPIERRLDRDPASDRERDQEGEREQERESESESESESD